MSASEDEGLDGQRASPTANTPSLVQDRGSNDEDDADLFGDDDDDEDITQNSRSRPARTLDDEELDSGDDLERDDRVARTVEDEGAAQSQNRFLKIVPCEVPRIKYPEGDEFYLLNMPNYLGIEQKAFDPDTYEVPSLPHDGDANRQTSAFSTAMSSVFWRYDPSDPSNLQSSARYVRWSDGSLTLQLATKPLEQYQVSALPMRQDFNRKLPPGTLYDPAKDSLTFLAAAHNTSAIDLQLVKAIDATMKIQSSGGATDDSELRLKQLLNANIEDHNPLVRVKELKEDPELARKAAEQFEKDRLRAQRKRENAEERLTMKRNNALGRVGLGSGRMGGAGLSVAGLEDELGMGMPTSKGKKKRGLRRNHHGEIYSDDEDETLPRRPTREDEYDSDGGFVADSDEEPEQYEDDDGLDDGEEEDDPDKDDLEIEGKKTVLEERGKQRERERTPKRSRADDLDDEDAEGEPDDELLRQSPQQARKKRRVIDDEDEDE